MDRRSFLRLTAMGIVGAQFDIEKLLWVPKIMITVPAKPEIITGGAITMHMINELHKKLIIKNVKILFEQDSIFYAQIERMSKK